MLVLFFFQTLPSVTPLPYIFWCWNPRRLRFLAILHGQLFRVWKPAELTFPPGLSRTPQEDALCLRERYKSCGRALLVFHVTWGISASLSLPLFSTLSFPRDEPTPGQRPFAIQPPSSHREFSPDPVAQVSSDSTLGCHRLSSFPGSQGTLRPKGPLGRYLGDAPPSFRVSLLFAQSKYQVTTFSLDWTVTSHLLWGQANPSHRTLPWPV